LYSRYFEQEKYDKKRICVFFRMVLKNVQTETDKEKETNKNK
jgi:hypothetical protein